MNKKIIANVCLFLTAIIWGFSFVAQVLGSDVIDPFSFNAIRFGVGAVSLIPVMLLLEKRPRGKLSAEQNAGQSGGPFCILHSAFCIQNPHRYFSAPPHFSRWVLR